MARLRWRAIARCLGVPRKVVRVRARMNRALTVVFHKPFRYRLPELRWWAQQATEPPTLVTLSLGPDGLRIEDA